MKFPGLNAKCGHLMLLKKMEHTTCSFLQKTTMEFLELVLLRLLLLLVLLRRSRKQSKEVSPLILLFSKTMMEVITCTSAAFGADNCNAGEQDRLMVNNPKALLHSCLLITS